MTDQATEIQQQLIEQQQSFNDTVNDAIMKTFMMNKEMIDGGATPTAISLANALAAADLIAAIIVESEKTSEAIDVMLDSLVSDMKKRAEEAFAFYTEQRAKREAESVDA